MLQPSQRPSKLLTYNNVVRITQYEAVTECATEDVNRFIFAWKAMVGEQNSERVIYRELSQQRPDWTALAKAEIDNPIKATFIEYLIAEPSLDLASLPAMASTEAARWRLTEDLHTVAFRFDKEEPQKVPGALMFNLFEIDGPPGMEQGFLMDWPPRGAFKIQEDATVSTVLHQRISPGATVKAFNRAEVVSAESYAEGIGRLEAAFPRASRKAAAGPLATGGRPPIRSHLGLFEIVALAPEGQRSASQTMKAAQFDRFGGPEVLVVREVQRPAPGPGQIRVRVRASAINPLDVKMRSGEVAAIYPPWFPDVVGYSVSGVIDAVGAGVTERSIGEEVYGINNPIMRHGYAEYVVGPAGFFYPKPTRLGFAAASAAPSIFATAYGALFLRAGLKSGQRVLIHGGSGAIGSCAVQLAKLAGAHVIATASARNVERVSQLGADCVVDYKTQRFEDFATELDLVVDTIGGETRERSWRLLRKGGVLASLVPPPPDQAVAAQYGVQAFMVHGHPNIAQIMPEMTMLLESGKLAEPQIAARFPLSDASAAHAEYERSAPQGRIVLEIED